MTEIREGRGKILNPFSIFVGVDDKVKAVMGIKVTKACFKSVRHPGRSAHLGRALTATCERPFAENLLEATLKCT